MLVSPAKGVASQEMAGLSAPPPATTTIDGGGYTAGRACARIFILWELRRLYNLPVVRRYEVAYARIATTIRLALGHRLGNYLTGLAVGDKKQKKREGRSGTPRSNCVREIDAPPALFRLSRRTELG